jgi:mono/diheme cytochrome c family protein
VNRTIAMLVIACASSVSAVASAAAERVGDFSLLDQKGYFHRMGYYDNHKAIALLVQSNGSKATAKAVADFKAAQDKYKGQVKFFMINPFGATADQRAAVQKELSSYGVDVPVLMDDSQIVSRSLGITKASEVILLDPKAFTVVYRGHVGEPLNEAIDDVVAGRPVKDAKSRIKGEKLKFAADMPNGKKVSYSKEIAPILADNCARCHRANGIAPFAMNSYGVIKGWAPMIREVVRTKRMPPGQIDPNIGHFAESYTLTPAETQTLVSWIEAGANNDGGADPLTALKWPNSKWDKDLGEPDLIVKVPPQRIPATGVLDYIRVVVPIEGLDRDRFVRASQYVAGDRTVLHHTLNALIPPGQPADARAFLGGGDPNEARITAYIPGAQPQIEPANTGGLLRKGSKLALQLHYTTNGKETTDASEIGLWFYKDNEVPAERMSGQCACIFTRGWKNIPPNDPDFEMTQTITIPKEAYIHSMLPHMHFRGKRMRFYADYPDGRSEELINIASYNYNWQLDYELAKPIRVPAGTKVRVIAAFDNSTQNKANPDANRSVPWGQQSWDEMFFGSVTYKFVDQSGAKLSSAN